MNILNKPEFDVGDIVTHKNMAGMWKIAGSFLDLPFDSSRYILVNNNYFAVIKAKAEDLSYLYDQKNS